MRGRGAAQAAESRRDNKVPRHATQGKHAADDVIKNEKTTHFKENQHKLRFNKSYKRFDGSHQARAHGVSENVNNKENQVNTDGGNNSSSNGNGNGNSNSNSDSSRNVSSDDAYIKTNNPRYNNNNSRYNNSKSHNKINRVNGSYEDHRQNQVQFPVVISDSSNSDFTFDVTPDDVMLSKKTFMESYSQFLSMRKDPNIDVYLHYNYMLTGHIFRQHSMQVLVNVQNEMKPSNNAGQPLAGGNTSVGGSSHNSIQSASVSSS